MHSVSLGCPLLQDYSLLNLLAVFAIILSLSLSPCVSLLKLFAGLEAGETD